MKVNHANNPPYCVVIWDDAWSDAVNATSQKDAPDLHKAARYETRGWVLVDDARGISIFPERCLDDGDVSYRGRTFIPRSLVVAVTEVTLKTPRKAAHAKNPASSAAVPSAGPDPA